MTRLHTSRMLLIAATGLLFACAHTAPAPVTEISRASCSSGFDWSRASALTLDAERATEVAIDPASCATLADGSVVSYVAYTLPAGDKPYTVSIESLLTGQALFAPRATIFDSVGIPIRAIGKDEFTSRGGNLKATLFIRPEVGDQRFLVVSSEPSAVGTTDQRLVQSNQAVFIGTGTLYMGAEGRQSTTYALNGRVRLRAQSSVPSMVGGAAAQH